MKVILIRQRTWSSTNAGMAQPGAAVSRMDTKSICPWASHGHQDTDMHHRHQILIIGIHINRDGFQHSRQQVHKPQRRYNK